jgi:hypothetical protein
MNHCLQQVVSWAAIGLTCFSLAPPAASQPPAESQLNIVVVDGQGAINNIRQRAGRDAVVRVEDASHQPIGGAAVVFTLPSEGPGGSFANGEKTLVVTTDAQGQAIARGLKPNNTAGKFDIRVTASRQGQTASAVITQFNMAVQNAKSKSNTKLIVILVALGGAGAVGAALGARGSGSSPAAAPPAPPATISISPGSGSVGPP